MKKETKKQWRRTVVCFEIATGNRRQFKSLGMAAEAVGCSVSYLGQVLRGRQHVNDYICAYIEDEKKAVEKLHFYQSRKEYRRTAPKTVLKTKEVPLRIDSRTVIYVDPRNATEAYAEQYRKKLANAGKREAKDIIEMNNDLAVGKKKGGRK